MNTNLSQLIAAPTDLLTINHLFNFQRQVDCDEGAVMRVFRDTRDGHVK